MIETMSGATLQTMREGLGLTREDLGHAVQVQARTVKHWEHARARVPDDVAQAVHAWWAMVDRLTAQALQDAAGRARDGAPVVLVRYRKEADLWDSVPDWPRGAPWGLHAAVLARVLVALGSGAQGVGGAQLGAGGAVVRWWDAALFDAWRAQKGLADTAQARQQWAAEADFPGF